VTRRFDAVRNDERIVAAALHALASDPGAGMEQLAAAAGVGRATLYRRFPTRDELLARLREQARHDARVALKAARADEGTATEALQRLFRQLLPVADRYAYLARPDELHQAPDPVLAKPWLRVIKRGQDAGEFGSELPAEWWLAGVRAHFVQAAEAVAAGRPLDDAARLATQALVGGLRG
jgi:AcrR family transcriptional regulator